MKPSLLAALGASWLLGPPRNVPACCHRKLVPCLTEEWILTPSNAPHSPPLVNMAPACEPYISFSFPTTSYAVVGRALASCSLSSSFLKAS